MVYLHEHNRAAYEKIKDAMKNGIKKIAIPRATGSGKTYLIGALAEQYNDDKKLVLEPTRPLLDSIKEKFDEFGIENVDFMTYQRLNRLSDEDIAEMDYRFVFMDECHHGTSAKWGQKINYLMESHPDCVFLGTSATTIRNDGVDVIEALFENNAVSELPLSTAIAKGILPCPKYVTAIYRLDDEFEKLEKKIENSTNTKEEKKEFMAKIKAMRSRFDKAYGVPIILNQNIKEQNGKYLIFCANKAHLSDMRSVVIDWFQTAGFKNIHDYAIYSEYPEKDKEYKEFCSDNSDAVKLLFSINMLSEGLHLYDISGVIMLRPTRSYIVHRQQAGRVIHSENMGRIPLIIDLVNNFMSANDGVNLLKEIKDAIEKEKKNNPDFDDSTVDIDTYFIFEQVVEIREAFAEIEGQLQGNWDLHIRALKQFKEREGDCLVPKKHVEIVDGNTKINLGKWVLNIRSANKGTGRYLLTNDRVQQLDEIGFVWDELKNRFLINVDSCVKFYERNGRLPNKHSHNRNEKRLGEFLGKNSNKLKLPQWKIDLLENIPTFLKEKECSFDRFYRNALLYKERYGHTNIKRDDKIDGYNIGMIYNSMIQNCKKEKLTLAEIDKLKNIGINVTMGKFEKRFYRNIELAKQAVNDGVIITSENKSYKNVNLYDWYMNNQKKMSNEQLKIMRKLILKKRKNPINIIDVESGQVYTYSSISEASKALNSKFCIVHNDRVGFVAIYDRLTGRIKNPIYKGFRFEYADSV